MQSAYSLLCIHESDTSLLVAVGGVLARFKAPESGIHINERPSPADSYPTVT
jgi:hypothetical protein